ncbi:decapping nuclease Rai1p [Diutina catenulata]
MTVKRLPIESRVKVAGLKQPKQLFTFARDADADWVYDEDEVAANHMNYYYLPDSWVNNINLAAGMAKFRDIPDEKNLGDFSALLHALMLHEQAAGARAKVDMVTFRGLMTKILLVPFQGDGFTFDIVAFDGQLFMKSDAETELQRRRQQDDELESSGKKDYVDACRYSGYKFETVATLPRPWADCSRTEIENRPKSQVSNYEQFISVVRTGIGSAKMLLAGEVDAVYDYVPARNPVTHYVELKTATAIENPRQMANFEKKLFTTWAQSFLMGVSKVIYAFRDPNFVMRSVEAYETDEIPVLLKNNNQINSMAALKWYGAAIEWLLREIPRDDESKAWRLTYDPQARALTLAESPKEVNDRLRGGELLTPEFVAWRKSV